MIADLGVVCIKLENTTTSDSILKTTKLLIDNKADMLVIGAHGHTGIKDFIYGETVNAVRHELKIPVLIVNV